MKRLFLLQIVEDAAQPDGTHLVARIPGGGALERELVAVCTEAIVARGVRFRTEGQVRAAIAAGIDAALQAIKGESRWVLK